MAASSPPSSDEQFAIGSVLDGRYRIDGVLGTGGMGRVYRAEHTKIGRSVAIKVLHAAMGRNREASQRFQREAIASGRLDHPNIVGVSDFGVLDDGACYLVMEILEGESLGDRLARDTRIHWSEAINILRGVLYGLRHAHERGVVHRDIKPDNVYLAHKDGDPVIKILDFGIAKLYAGSDDDPASTRAGLTVGTPAYLSPEQAVGGAITPASDLYSASIVLYEMLAGRAPFEDRDPLAMLGAHVSRRPPRFAVIAPGVDIPPALEAIIQRGLVKTAADRISTAADYLAILEAFSPSPRTTGEWVSSAAQRLERQATERSDSTEIDPPPSEAPAQGQAHAATHPAPVVSPAPVVATTAALQAARGARGSAQPPVAMPAGASALSLPPSAHPVSLADAGEPIQLTWIVRSSVLVGAMIVLAIVLSVVPRCNASQPPAKAVTPSPRDKPAVRATK
jgi:serine/threonine-protein kinase